MNGQNTSSVNKRLYAFLALSGVGFILSFILSKTFYELQHGTQGFKSFCDMSDTMSCGAVASSSFAQLLPGFPLSSFAGGWYLALIFLGFMSLWTADPNWRRDTLKLSFLMSLFSVVMSIVYLVIMMTVLKTYCLYCLGIDAVNVLSLAVLWTLKPEKSELFTDRSKWKTFAGVILGSLVVGIIGFKVTLDMQGPDEIQVSQLADRILSTPPVPVPVAANLPTQGADAAPITIVEFIDFQCPHCRNGASIMKALMGKFPGKVKVVLKNFPLDGQCNRLIKQSSAQGGGHMAACEAAKVSICAHKEGKFVAVFEDLFDQQQFLKPGLPTEIAVKNGMDEAKVKSCITSPETEMMLSAGIEDGNTLGVQSTPTFFINGHKVEGAYPVPVWTKVIQRLLNGG
jgi:protein-disulfide isomerase